MGEFDKLKAALKGAGVSKQKIAAIVEWEGINDKDMLDVILHGKEYVHENFEVYLNEEECDKLFEAWNSQNAGGKRRRRRKSKRKKSNRKRKKKTRRRSKRRS
jgi:hypothetical protein